MPGMSTRIYRGNFQVRVPNVNTWREAKCFEMDRIPLSGMV
jgi:hypothetical protein